MSDEIQQALEYLRQGKLVSFPTETVYGLGADARNLKAVNRVFEIKGRPTDHPLIVHLPDSSHLAAWSVNIPKEAWQLAEAFWPGPLTLVLAKHPSVLNEITGHQETVALRVPDHPLALELLNKFNDGLVGPSANRFGRISPTTAQHVQADLGADLAYILDGGPCRVGIESTIVQITEMGFKILRPGDISATMIRAVLNRPLEGNDHQLRVSGDLASHYAPQKTLQLVNSEQLQNALQSYLKSHKKIAVWAFSAIAEQVGMIVYQAPTEPKSYARELYAMLRKLDMSEARLLILEKPPETSEWRAIQDRLGRASSTEFTGGSLA